MKGKLHGNRLRIGRYSEPDRIYHITTVTRCRDPLFADLHPARLLVQILKAEQKHGAASTLAYVLMPDHLHWLMKLDAADDLSRIVGRVKSLAARRLDGRVWQGGFHDHAVRREEDLVEVARYIIANPVRAGLVRRVGDYPHWDAIWL